MHSGSKVWIFFKNGMNKHCVYLTKPFTTQTQAVPIDVKYEKAKPYSQIPGPNLLQLIQNFLPGGKFQNKEPIDMHTIIHKEYGNIIQFPKLLGRKDIIFIYDVKDFETVFRTEGTWPHRRPFAFEYFRKHIRPDVYKNYVGLVNDQGERWAHMRSAVNPVMLEPKTVRSCIPVVEDVALDFVAKIKAISDANQEMPANFVFELKKWALESVAVIALDQRLGVITNDKDPEIQRIIKSAADIFNFGYQVEILPPIWKYVPIPIFKQLMDALSTMTDVSKKYVDIAMDRISKEDTKHNKEDDDESVLEKLLKINPEYALLMAIDMLLAGVDTTSIVVANLLYHLAKNPSKQDKLREEVLDILPSVHSRLTPMSLNSVPYMRACIKESMRLASPVPGTIRGVGRNLVLQGYQIPKDIDVAMVGGVLHLDDGHFARSKEFIPERWLTNDKEMEGCPNHGKSDNAFAYLPFGFGPRTCIGKRFAEMETSVLTFRILREFKVEWHYGPLKYFLALIITPSSDLKYKMIPFKGK